MNWFKKYKEKQTKTWIGKHIQRLVFTWIYKIGLGIILVIVGGILINYTKDGSFLDNILVYLYSTGIIILLIIAVLFLVAGFYFPIRNFIRKLRKK